VTHKFTVGQTVDLTRTVLRPTAPGEYKIQRLMPASDGDPSNPSYRVKNIGENYERVVRESEITGRSGGTGSVFS
jgi:hypothetical protein